MNWVIRKRSKKFILDTFYIYLIVSQASSDGEKNGPKFDEPIPNVTVTVGRDASLPCVVSNLGTYKVVWVHIERQMVITMNRHVITRIPRYSIAVSAGRPGSDKNTWFLRVTGAQQEDKGYYMCQVNTNPVISQVGYLQVTVPPVFLDDDSMSASTVVVQENENVTLNCRAQGFPSPKIAWKREDGRDIVLSRKNIIPVIEGESIYFEKVTRYDMAGYLCIAANGVPPTLIKRIFIDVEFSPIILVTNQLTTSAGDSTTVLQCQSEANPRARTYWIRDGHTLSSNYKYTISTVQNSYQTFTKLEIKNTTRADFGEYTCLSENSFGETEGSIQLFEYFTTSTSTEFILPNTSTRLQAAKILFDKYVNKSSVKTLTTDEYWYIQMHKMEEWLKLNTSFIHKGNEGTMIDVSVYMNPKTIFNFGIEFSSPRLHLILASSSLLLVL